MNPPVAQTSHKRRLDADVFETASEELSRPMKKPKSVAAQLDEEVFNEAQQEIEVEEVPEEFRMFGDEIFF